MKKILFLTFFTSFIFHKIDATSIATDSPQKINFEQPISNIVVPIDYKPATPVPWQKIDKQITNKYTLSGDLVGRLAFHTLLGLIVHKICSIAHELGHAAAIKLLFNISTMLAIPITLNPNVFHGCFFEGTLPQVSIKTALTYAAGPLFGLATSYAILKINSILQEIITNTNVPIKNRLMKGLKKPFIHNKQLFGIQIGALCAMYINSIQFIPRKAEIPQGFFNNAEVITVCNDGYGFLQALGFKNIPTFDF